MTLATIRKFLVAAIGAALEAVNAGLVPAAYAHWVAVVVAVATALGVYAVPNSTPAPAKAAPAAPVVKKAA